MFDQLYSKVLPDLPPHILETDELRSKDYRRLFGYAGMSLVVTADQPFAKKTFSNKINAFRSTDESFEKIYIHHHFAFPEIKAVHWGKMIQRKEPWVVYRKDRGWIYKGVINKGNQEKVFKIAVFNDNHSRARIFSPDAKVFQAGGLKSLTTFPTDQLMLLQTISHKNACIFHSSGMIINGQGLLFLGHSGAGKSTMVTLLKDIGEILCDDRNIIRSQDDGFRLYGSWSHGDVPHVSPRSAPVKALFFIEKTSFNRLTPLSPFQGLFRLPAFAVRSISNKDWWARTLGLIEKITNQVPMYRLQFDKSGKIAQIINELVA